VISWHKWNGSTQRDGTVTFRCANLKDIGNGKSRPRDTKSLPRKGPYRRSGI